MRIGFACLAAAASLLAFAPAADATGFQNPRYVVDQRGDIGLIGNTLLACEKSSQGCSAAQQGKGGGLDNNDHKMSYVDVDGDRSTFNSASAKLKLPVPAEQVTFAGLYWGGDLNNSEGSSEQPAPNAKLRNKALLAPAGQDYEKVGAEKVQREDTRYLAYTEVTNIVRRAGDGVYTVADVQIAQGDFGFGGWHMIVAWTDPSERRVRNIAVFDGIEQVGKRGRVDTLSIPISGFRTPAAGEISGKLLTAGFDGDLGRGGDSIRFEGKELSNKVNPVRNYFNSTIADANDHLTAKDPSFVNQMGYDIDEVNVSKLLDHKQKNGVFDFRTSADRFSPTLFAFRIDTIIPDMVIDKTTIGPLVAGLGASYQLVARNDGTKETTAPVTVTDTLPAGIVPTAASGDGWVCSIVGQDVGCSRSDKLGIETAFAPITVAVSVSPGAVGPVTNTALVAGGGENNESNNTDAVTDPVSRISDLAIVKTGPTAPVNVEAQNVTYTLTVSNSGPAQDSPIVTDPLPVEVQPISATSPTGSCQIAGSALACQLNPLDPGASTTITVVVDVDNNFNCGQTITNVATVGGANQDPNPANNSDGHSFTTVPTC